MKIDVIFSASEVNSARIQGKTVVVIDVLRATSVMVTALNNGAHKVVPVLSPDEAFDYYKNNTGRVLLAGERYSDKIEGFDYGNSPLDMLPGVVDGATLVMTTTNGTLAIRKCADASELFVSAFLNARATVNVLNSFSEIVLVCAGSSGSFSLEDTLCAGYLTKLMVETKYNAEISDSAFAALHLYYGTQKNVHKLAAKGNHYSHLKKKGLNDDLEYCFRKNVIDMVCCREGDAIYVADRKCL